MRRTRPVNISARHLVALALLGATAAAGCSGSKPTVALSGDPRVDPAPASIPAFLAKDPDERFTTLLTCAGLVGAAPVIGGPGPVTLFAPTNEAFRKAGVSCAEGDELDAADAQALLRTLQQHVVDYDVRFTEPEGYDPAKPPRLVEIVDSGSVTLDSILLDAPGTELVINADKTVRTASSQTRAKIIDADLQAPNGIVQVIDMVLTPPAKPALPPTTAAPAPYG